MNTELAEFLAAGAKTPFGWGQEDCCLFACDWIRSQRGVDPAERFRGRYQTELQARRLIHRSGGFLRLVDDAMAQAGILETTDPLPGDVGVVVTEQGEALAIRSRVGWVAKAPIGISAGPFMLLKAWSI